MNAWSIPYCLVIVGSLVTAVILLFQDFRAKRRRYVRKVK